MRPARILIAALALAGMVSPTARAEAPRVVATVAPIHSLVASVMAEVGEPALLIDGAASPHGYAMAPSEAAALAAADLVFWVGPALEQFLEDRLPVMADGAGLVALMEADGVRRLPARERNIWISDDVEDDHGHGHEDDHGDHADVSDEEGGHEEGGLDGGGHDHGAFDSHIWLDPQNAVAMVAAIAEALSREDPPNAERYARNATRLSDTLRAMDGRLAERLGPVADVPFVVFHDAYAYLETRYGLTALGAIALSPDRQPGARTVGEIQATIAEQGVACVFAEPQFPPRLVETVVGGSNARSAVLDPLGVGLTPGAGLYLDMMTGLADTLVACLGGEE